MLLELFTSQGCSSCPPADRLLSTLGEREGVIALAFHVDYWNYIGWRDPFSSAAASRRQRRYGRAIADQRVYTPMLVIDGREHVVGSFGDEIAAAIDRARRRAPSGWSVAIEDASIAGDRLRAAVSVRRPPGAGGARLLAALRESGLETEVRRGENAGATLRNDFIVRQLIELDGSQERQTIDTAARASEGGGQRSLVVFAQKPRSLEVLAAAAVDL